jgi:outer membrane protein
MFYLLSEALFLGMGSKLDSNNSDTSSVLPRPIKQIIKNNSIYFVCFSSLWFLKARSRNLAVIFVESFLETCVYSNDKNNYDNRREMKTICRVILCLLVLQVMGNAPLVVNKLPAAENPRWGEGTEPPPFTDKLQDFSAKSTSDAPLSSEKTGLNIRDFVRLVREKNEQISYQDSELVISREAVKGAKAIFEPVFINSYQEQDDKRRNTVQELVSQGFTPEFRERSGSYQAAVEGLVPTGGRLRFAYTRRDFKNNIDDRYGVLSESQSVIGASITQPLLKGGGITATRAGIQVAEADADIAFQTYRGQMMKVIADAILTYWDLYLAREKYKIRKESEQNADKILKDNIIRVKTGKMAETEVMEARAGLAMRRSLVSEARQATAAAMNSLRTFLSSSAGEKNEIELTEQPHLEDVTLNYPDSLTRSFKLRAEYIASRKKMEREDVRLVFAENQTWPQLDLKGSYNMNGLADTPGNSWNDAMKREYQTWFIGFELRFLMGGDKKSKSELEAIRQRKRQALLEFKAVEVSLANAVDTAIKSVHNVQDQVRQLADMTDMNRRLLEAEIARFKAGKSNSRNLLEREEELNKARETEIESLVRYRKALMQLDFAEGAILGKHGIEVMEASL